ncbi:uncharacterized protein LOC133516566 [Cydia pomonella]|uniref:uncharacterized protein LOC133516566 n=1 Tax=Cydia pomonella TaxID=82600 RepID=UPI002ADDACEB|nr:uncharacterized protein LOC133516566 [Cydia pomonella]
MWRWVALGVLWGSVWSQFFDCHDDPSYDPEEGQITELQYSWLGALQYIHVKNGTPHYFRVPRVVLISRQFVLSTAVDAAVVPHGYALGNVIFGDYERDEVECETTVQALANMNAECEPAILLMPVADVLIHPEFKHFGARSSVALLKLITTVKSRYVLPVCLPFRNFLERSNGKQMEERLYHIDFASDVPRDFVEEEKEVLRISLLPRELCYIYDLPENNTRLKKERITCTTGCGFRSGAPSLVHEHTGHWSVVALAHGGTPCPDPLRSHRPPAPPRHTVLYPYVPWITAAITGKPLGAFSKDDPFGYVMPRASPYDQVGHAWVGHWWMGGVRCYDRGDAALDIFRFYQEIFRVKPVALSRVNYHLEIVSPRETIIICVKVGMPFQIGQPQVYDLDSPEVSVDIPLLQFKHQYSFEVEAWGYNHTESQSSDSQADDSDYQD